MNTTTTEDYVAKRAELLANLVLTRQKEVEIIRFRTPEEAGLHLLAKLPSIGGVEAGLPAVPCVGVVVMGTDEPLETEADATTYARKHREYRPGFFLIPIVLLLFSMDGDRGYFGWLMEPRVSKSEGPTLMRVISPSMTKITKSSTEVIFRASETWYEEMVQLVVRDNKSK